MDEKPLRTMWTVLFGAYGVLFGRIYSDIGWIQGREYYGPLPELCYLIGFLSGMTAGLVFGTVMAQKHMRRLSLALWFGLPIFLIALIFVQPLIHSPRE